jgi:predicted HicB family RNase H-like nuclease
MTLENDHYAYRVLWSTEDEEYVGLCAEFPSLSWLAVAPEDALRGIRELVAATVADLGANAEPVPAPLVTRRYSGRFLVRVPPEVHRQLALEAAEAGVSLNRLVSARLSQPAALPFIRDNP